MVAAGGGSGIGIAIGIGRAGAATTGSVNVGVGVGGSSSGSAGAASITKVTGMGSRGMRAPAPRGRAPPEAISRRRAPRRSWLSRPMTVSEAQSRQTGREGQIRSLPIGIGSKQSNPARGGAEPRRTALEVPRGPRRGRCAVLVRHVRIDPLSSLRIADHAGERL